MTELHELTIAEAGRNLRSGALTSHRLTCHLLDRIGAFDGRFNAFTTVTEERALADASRADRELAQGVDRGPLHGIPYALKDTINTAGIRTSMGSAMFINHVPERDSRVAAKLLEAGGVLLGKLATYEFGTVGPAFDLPFPPVRNPWNERHITGGSSSGCAAAIAAGFARLVIGSDAGGSIRSPASYCGAVGLKPTYGAVDADGFYLLSPALDHVGIMAATVEEADLGFSLLADRVELAGGPTASDITNLKIAYARDWSEQEANGEVLQALDETADRLRKLGAIVEEIALPDYSLIEAAGTVIIQKQAFDRHAELLRSSPSQYGKLSYQNLISGLMLTDADLEAAFVIREKYRNAFDLEVFARFDALLLASTLTTAPPFSDFSGNTPRWTPMRTFPFNVTGHPALAVPSGLSKAGLPMGVQIAGPHGGEYLICRVGAAAAAHLRYPAFEAVQVAECA